MKNTVEWLQSIVQPANVLSANTEQHAADTEENYIGHSNSHIPQCSDAEPALVLDGSSSENVGGTASEIASQSSTQVEQHKCVNEKEDNLGRDISQHSDTSHVMPMSLVVNGSTDENVGQNEDDNADHRRAEQEETVSSHMTSLIIGYNEDSMPNVSGISADGGIVSLSTNNTGQCEATLIAQQDDGQSSSLKSLIVECAEESAPGMNDVIVGQDSKQENMTNTMEEGNAENSHHKQRARKRKRKPES